MESFIENASLPMVVLYALASLVGAVAAIALAIKGVRARRFPLVAAACVQLVIVLGLPAVALAAVRAGLTQLGAEEATGTLLASALPAMLFVCAANACTTALVFAGVDSRR
jgi:hypothetical protein